MGGREGKKTGSAVSLVGSSSLRRGESYETVLQIHAGASHFFGRAFTLERASTPASLRSRVKLRTHRSFVRGVL